MRLTEGRTLVSTPTRINRQASSFSVIAQTLAMLCSLVLGTACASNGIRSPTVDRGPSLQPLASQQSNPRFRGRLQEQTRFEEINAEDAPPPSGNKPVFTQDWVSTSSVVWRQELRTLAGRNGARGLEVGSFEGRSAIWFLEHILTAPDARLTSVDLFGERLDAYFDHNLRVTGHAAKVEKRQGKSQKVLRTLPTESYDFVYVDGCHLATCALTDIVLSWDLLKTGGVLIIDDYGWTGPPLDRPKLAVDAFLAIYEPHYELLHKQFQVLVRKTSAAY